MYDDVSRFASRLAALALALAVHTGLLILVRYSHVSAQNDELEPSPSTQLIFIEAAAQWIPEPPVSAIELDGRVAPRAARTLESSERVDAVIVDTPNESGIDWGLQAQQSAERAAPELLEKWQRRCRPKEGVPPEECTPRAHTFDWNPQPGRVGVDGGLPYVRLGKRCVLGLGFFACAIGKLPEPNGDLFDGMRDPDRPYSSVPDLPQ